MIVCKCSYCKINTERELMTEAADIVWMASLSCPSLADRANKFLAKLEEQTVDGVVHEIP